MFIRVKCMLWINVWTFFMGRHTWGWRVAGHVVFRCVSSWGKQKKEHIDWKPPNIYIDLGDNCKLSVSFSWATLHEISHTICIYHSHYHHKFDVQYLQSIKRMHIFLNTLFAFSGDRLIQLEHNKNHLIALNIMYLACSTNFCCPVYRIFKEIAPELHPFKNRPFWAFSTITHRHPPL